MVPQKQPQMRGFGSNEAASGIDTRGFWMLRPNGQSRSRDDPHCRLTEHQLASTRAAAPGRADMQESGSWVVRYPGFILHLFP